MKQVISKLKNSMVGYLPIKILEGVIGMVMLKIYTSLFIPDIYGRYSIINSTINIIFLVYIGWLLQSVIRFTNEYYIDEEKRKKFFSSIMIIWLILVVSIGIIFIALNYVFPSFLEDINVRFAFVIAFVFLSYSLSQTLLALVLYAGKRLVNAVLLLSAIMTKLILTIVLYKTYSTGVDTIFISHGITDLLIGMIGLYASQGYKNIKIKYFSWDLIKSFIKYGYPLIGLALTMSVLNVSDRYIIKYFEGEAEVGLYVANYAIPAAVFSLIMAGLSRGIYPMILSQWNKGNKEEATNSLALGGKYYLMLCLPAATGLALLSEPMAKLFLDQKYLGGHMVIGAVAFGMFFLGLSEYFNKGWELKKDTKHILVNCIIASVANIVLNMIFVPFYGFVAASYTTLLSFFIYMLLSKIRENKDVRFIIYKKTLVNILLSTLIMAIIVIVCTRIIPVNIVSLIVIIILAVMAYFASLYLTGEMKETVKKIRHQ